MDSTSFTFYPKFFKPLMDRLAALLLLAVTAPVWVMVLLLNLVLDRGKVFFFQLRPGLNGVPFYMIKFKSMRDPHHGEELVYSDANRLTPFGKFLRASSLDELPQLINVLRGEMSLVGPRPLLMEYLTLYSPEQARRHLVKPGITGWAQVNGRNAINWKQKLALDVWYADHQSFLLDLKILFITLGKVIRAQGINAPGTATMEKFNGNN